MQTKLSRATLVVLLTAVLFSCQKNANAPAQDSQTSSATTSVTDQNVPGPETPNFNLEVILRGEDKRFGLVKFRQDNDANKIVTLDVWVRDLEPNHMYLLQRAVDTQLDGNCTGTAWLTLGRGLDPQSIQTNAAGTGSAALFRDLSAAPSGSTFDIHFQVIDAATSVVVLSSDCYQFTVR